VAGIIDKAGNVDRARLQALGDFLNALVAEAIADRVGLPGAIETATLASECATRCAV